MKGVTQESLWACYKCLNVSADQESITQCAQQKLSTNHAVSHSDRVHTVAASPMLDMLTSAAAGDRRPQHLYCNASLHSQMCMLSNLAAAALCAALCTVPTRRQLRTRLDPGQRLS
jgi:hypothetical protein